MSEDGDLGTVALSTNLTSPASASSTAAAAAAAVAAAVVQVTLFYKSFRKAREFSGPYILIFNW